MYRAYFIMGFLGLLIFCFETFSIVFGSEWIGLFDSFFIANIRDAIEVDFKIEMMKILSKIGSFETILIVSFILMLAMFLKRKFILGAWFGVSIALSVVILKILKEIVARDRPNENWLSSASGFSYPSGHSLAISLFCSLLFLLIISSKIKIFWKTFMGILGALLIFLIMYSRVYLGVHYPSDVLGGFLLGLTLAFFSTGIYVRFFKD
ncbi:hypothetical protein BKH42_03840 [Helicobacter sp. 13S00482-2]|uniref:phosphatase PAP2 family protein n=1 Tax=Helicobacter sp. 13S00482-2 TaxID=1476200 RepID=UPI000BA7D9F9|nr:phosphatase PAP2 family protein [Helicobacter sp. 13S00482-2]PAF53874.1 hypothetical protein BKH42_03840 [Helicobacter sp. 13S00482-2]